jgi:ferritin-like protein
VDESHGMSRAALVRRGALGSAGVLLGSSVRLVDPPAATAAIPDGDLAYLRVLLALELLLADYEAQALASGKLGRRSTALMRQLRQDDLAHVAGLSALLTGSGQTPTTADDIDFSYPRQSFATQGSIVKLGWTLSRLALGGYLGAVEKLETSELRGPIAQIAANEAQHLSALAQLEGRPLVGKAFAASLSIDEVSSALDRFES